MNIFEFGSATDTEEKCLALAISLGLLPVQRTVCDACGRHVNRERGKTRHSINGRLRFSNRTCRKSYSLYTGSLIAKINIPISSLLRLVYCYSQNLKVGLSATHSALSRVSGCKWFRILRRLITLKILITRDVKIGGIGKPVEIDETHLCKKKNNTGHVLEMEVVWIVDSRCREDKTVFMRYVTCRSAENLEIIICECVETGTRIITDMWRGYWHLNDFGFYHFTINHKYYFVDPIDRSIHTQNIERVWRSLKEFLPSPISRENLFCYLGSFVYSYGIRDVPLLDRFYHLIDLIKEIL